MEFPPLRYFLFFVMLLSLFILLVNWTPVELNVQAEEQRELDIPDYFDALELTMYAETQDFNITSDMTSFESFGFGGHSFDWLAHYGNNRIVIRHYFWFLFIPHGYHNLHWIDARGIDVSTNQWWVAQDYWVLEKDELDDNYNVAEGFASFTVKCEHLQMKCWFAFNMSKYDLPSQAWDDLALSFLLAISFDELGTGWNVWSLIASIMWFDCPNIHPVINAIIAIPLWITAVFLISATVIAILKSLPFT